MQITNPKIQMIGQEENLAVSPAYNYSIAI